MNGNDTISEKQLIKYCIEGERKSQRELYDLYASKMFSICMRYSKNQLDAEDMLQEGFLKLFNNLSRFRGDGSFEGWVKRIFINTAIEFLRRKSIETTGADGLENALIDHYKNGLDNLYEKDLMKDSSKLSIGYRTVFNLYAIEGYSHKEIGSILGITESTSKSQFSRAKALLRSIIKETDNQKIIKEK